MKKEVNPKETTRAQAFELWQIALPAEILFYDNIEILRSTRLIK